MAYTQKDGDGSLFKNQDKRSDRHPDYRGKCKIDGREYTIAGWIKQGSGGKPSWLSLRIEEPRERAAGGGEVMPEGEEAPF